MAVVTGASRGIARATAERLAKDGASGKYREFRRFRPSRGRVVAEKSPVSLLSGFRRNSLLNGTGNFETSTADYFSRNREFSSNNRETAWRFIRLGQTARSRRDSFTVRSDGLARASSIFCRTPFGSGFSVATTFQRRNHGTIKFTGQRRSSSTPSSRHIQLKSYGGVPSL